MLFLILFSILILLLILINSFTNPLLGQSSCSNSLELDLISSSHRSKCAIIESLKAFGPSIKKIRLLNFELDMVRKKKKKRVID